MPDFFGRGRSPRMYRRQQAAVKRRAQAGFINKWLEENPEATRGDLPENLQEAFALLTAPPSAGDFKSGITRRATARKYARRRGQTSTMLATRQRPAPSGLLA